MTKKVGHPPAPQLERPDARVTHPRKHVAPSTPDILRDTFTTIVSAAFPNLMAGTILARSAAQKIQKAAEPIIGEARHAYQRMRLDQLRGEAHGLPVAFGARLEQLAPDLQTYEPGLNQDAIGKDLDEAAYLIGEYQALGRLPVLHGLADTVSEKYQAAFAEAVGSAEARVQQRIIERHQLINQFYHIQEQGQTFEAPAILKQRIGELTAAGDLDNPLAEVKDQTKLLAASMGVANLTELYGRVAQVKTENTTPGVVKVADAKTAWATDQLTNHFAEYWEPQNVQTLEEVANQHNKALSSAVILDRTHYETDATRAQKFDALATMDVTDKTSWDHGLLVIRNTETDVAARELANQKRRQLDPRSGFKTAWQLEYTGAGWGGILADKTEILKTVEDLGKTFGITDLIGDTLNDNPLTRTYQAMKTSGNPFDMEKARLAEEASHLFINKFNRTDLPQEEIALKTEADWAAWAVKTDHDAKLIAAFNGVVAKAEDSLPKPEESWADKRVAFVIKANQLFGVENRAGGHATDDQVLRSHYAITANMLNVMREQYRYGISKEYAEKYLAFFNDESAPIELRRMGATVYEYYLIQHQKRDEDHRVRDAAQSAFDEVRGEANMLSVETGGEGGSIYGGNTWYDPSVYKAPNQVTSKAGELMAKVERMEATNSLLELRAKYAGEEKYGLPGMAQLLREYGGEHRNWAEKTFYVLAGWTKYRYAELDEKYNLTETLAYAAGLPVGLAFEKYGERHHGVDPETDAKIRDVNDMISEIDQAIVEVRWNNFARFQMVNQVNGHGTTFREISDVTKEAQEVIVYRDIVQDIEAMALASVATAGVGAAMGLTMRTGKLTNDLLRASKMLVRIVGRQSTFLHVNAAGKWLMRGHQDLYDFSKGYRYNLFNLGVQIVEFELMGMAHHQVRALRHLKDVAKSASTLRTVLATTAKFSHDVVRDTLFFHGWTPFGAAIRGFAHGDMAEIQGGIEALGSAEGFHHSLVLTFGLGMPIGRAPSKMAVKYALKHGIREMKPVAARQERIATIEQQIATLAARGASDSRTPALIFELRQQQEQIAAHNAQVMEKLTEQYRDSEELKQQAQAMKAQVDHSRFNTATAQQTELKHRLEVAQGANAPAVQQIALLKRAEQASQVRATLATRLLHHQMLPAQVAMATQLEATYFRNQRQLAENGQQIEKLERAMARPEISNDALLAKSSRLALALQKHIALMEEVNAMSPGRFTPEAIRALRERRAFILQTVGPSPNAETQATIKILHDQQLQTLSTQAAVVRRPTAVAQQFMQVFKEATTTDGTLRKEIATVLHRHAEAMLHGAERAPGTAVEYSGAPWMEHFMTHATEAAREIFAAVRRNWSAVHSQNEAALAETISNDPQNAANAIIADIANILSWSELLQFAAADPTDIELQEAITRGAQRLQTTLESVRQLPSEIRTATQINEKDPVAAFLKAFCETPLRAKQLRTALAHIDTLTHASGKPTHYIEQLDRALGIKEVAKPDLDPQLQREAQLAKQQITERYKTYPDDHTITTFVRNLPIARAHPEYHIYVLKGMEEVNALALPDGTVFVSDRLLADCTYEEEVAFVLQHEFTHIKGAHATRPRTESNMLAAFGRDRFNEYAADLEDMIRDKKHAANPYGGIIFLRRMAEAEVRDSKNGEAVRDITHGNTFTRLINLEYAIRLIDMDALQFELHKLPSELGASFENQPDAWRVFEGDIEAGEQVSRAETLAQNANLTAALVHYRALSDSKNKIDRRLKFELLDTLDSRIIEAIRQSYPQSSDQALRCMRTFLLQRGLKLVIQADGPFVEFLKMLEQLPPHFPATRSAASNLFATVADTPLQKIGPAAHYARAKTTLDALRKAYPHVSKWNREEAKQAEMLLTTFDPSTSKIDDYFVKLAEDGLGTERPSMLSKAAAHFKLTHAEELQLLAAEALKSADGTDTQAQKPTQIPSRIMANAERAACVIYLEDNKPPSRQKAERAADDFVAALDVHNFEELLTTLDAYSNALERRVHFRQPNNLRDEVLGGFATQSPTDPLHELLWNHPDMIYPRLLGKAGKATLSNTESIQLLQRMWKLHPSQETMRALGLNAHNYTAEELLQILAIVGKRNLPSLFLTKIRYLNDRNAVFDVLSLLTTAKVSEGVDHEGITVRRVSRVELTHVVSHIFLTYTFDMNNPVERDQLLTVSASMTDPITKARLQKSVLAKHLPTLDPKAQYDLLFNDSRIMDAAVTDIRENYVDQHVNAAPELRSIRQLAVQRIEEAGKMAAGIHILSEGVGEIILKDKERMLKALLMTRRSNAELRNYFAEIIMRGVVYERDSGMLATDDKSLHQVAIEETMKLGVTPETYEKILYQLNFEGRRLIANELLVGDGGILLDRDRRVRTLAWFFNEFVDAPATPSEKVVHQFLQRAFMAVAEKADVSTLYFLLHPIIVARMLGTPQETTPWKDAIRSAHATLLGTVPSDNKYDANEILNDAAHATNRMVTRKSNANDTGAVRSEMELALPYLESELETVSRLPPVEFVKSLASQLGAPGVRFLQTLGLFTELPPELQREFDDVYDNMHGQFKLSAFNTLEKNWGSAGDDRPLENLGSRVGGGSLVSVYRMTVDGKSYVARVSNPNTAYQSEVTAYNLAQILEADPDLARGLPLLSNIRKWILEDLAPQDPVTSRDFVTQNDHFQVDGNPYTIRIPDRLRQGAKFSVEGFVDGQNLTQWDALSIKHDMKRIVSLIAKNAAQQLMSGIVHPDMHIGNIRITDANEIFWLDSSYVLKLDARDKAFIEDVMMSGGDMPAVAKQLVTYLMAFPENSTLQPDALQQRLLERISSGSTTDVGETVSGIVAAISEAKGVIPLHMMLLLKNALSLDRLAKKAGFATLAEAVTTEDSPSTEGPTPEMVVNYSGAPWMVEGAQKLYARAAPAVGHAARAIAGAVKGWFVSGKTAIPKLSAPVPPFSPVSDLREIEHPEPILETVNRPLVTHANQSNIVPWHLEEFSDLCIVLHNSGLSQQEAYDAAITLTKKAGLGNLEALKYLPDALTALRNSGLSPQEALDEAIRIVNNEGNMWALFEGLPKMLTAVRDLGLPPQAAVDYLIEDAHNETSADARHEFLSHFTNAITLGFHPHEARAAARTLSDMMTAFKRNFFKPDAALTLLLAISGNAKTNTWGAFKHLPAALTALHESRWFTANGRQATLIAIAEQFGVETDQAFQHLPSILKTMAHETAGVQGSQEILQRLMAVVVRHDRIPGLPPPLAPEDAHAPGKVETYSGAPFVEDLAKQAAQAVADSLTRPAWMDDARIAWALWQFNPEYAPDGSRVAKTYKAGERGNNELVHAIIGACRGIAANDEMADYAMSGLINLLAALPEHSNLFRPPDRQEEAHTETVLEAHLREAYKIGPKAVVLRALALLEAKIGEPNKYRNLLPSMELARTRNFRRPGEAASEAPLPQSAAGVTVSDAEVDAALHRPKPIAPAAKVQPIAPAADDIVLQQTTRNRNILGGNEGGALPDTHYNRRDMTGMGSPDPNRFTIPIYIDAETSAILSVGRFPEDVRSHPRVAAIQVSVHHKKIAAINATDHTQPLHPRILELLSQSLIGQPVAARKLGDPDRALPDTTGSGEAIVPRATPGRGQQETIQDMGALLKAHGPKRLLPPYHTRLFSMTAVMQMPAVKAARTIIQELRSLLQGFSDLDAYTTGNLPPEEMNILDNRGERMLALLQDIESVTTLPPPVTGEPVASVLEGYLRVYYDSIRNKPLLEKTLQFIDDHSVTWLGKKTAYADTVRTFKATDDRRAESRNDAFDNAILLNYVRVSRKRFFGNHDNAAVRLAVQQNPALAIRALQAAVGYDLLSMHRALITSPEKIATSLLVLLRTIEKYPDMPRPDGGPPGESAVAAYLRQAYQDSPHNHAAINRALQDVDALAQKLMEIDTHFFEIGAPYRRTQSVEIPQPESVWQTPPEEGISPDQGTRKFDKIFPSGPEAAPQPKLTAEFVPAAPQPRTPAITAAPDAQIQTARTRNIEILAGNHGLPPTHYSMRSFQSFSSSLGSPSTPNAAYSEIPGYVNASDGTIIALTRSLPEALHPSAHLLLGITLRTFDPSLHPALSEVYMQLVVGDLDIHSPLPDQVRQVLQNEPAESPLHQAYRFAQQEAGDSPPTIAQFFKRRLITANAAGAPAEVSEALASLVGTPVVASKPQPGSLPPALPPLPPPLKPELVEHRMQIFPDVRPLIEGARRLFVEHAAPALGHAARTVAGAVKGWFASGAGLVQGALPAPKVKSQDLTPLLHEKRIGDAENRMKVTQALLLDAIDKHHAQNALAHQQHIEASILGSSYHEFHITPDYKLTLRTGYGNENGCGFEFELDGVGKIGFQETDNAIEIVRLQGSHMTQAAAIQFREFSGGVDPLPWLATAAGRILAQRAQATGKELRWIDGERVAAGYPHYRQGKFYVHTLDEARAFWNTPHPDLEQMGNEYDAAVARGESKTSLNENHMPAIMYRQGPRIQKAYDDTANALGFTHTPGDAWHRYSGNPDHFGSNLHNRDGVIGWKFANSLKTADAALAPLANFTQGRTERVASTLHSPERTAFLDRIKAAFKLEREFIEATRGQAPKPDDTLVGVDQLVKTSNDITTLFKLEATGANVWDATQTIARDKPQLFTADHVQLLKSKGSNADATLVLLIHNRPDLFNVITAAEATPLTNETRAQRLSIARQGFAENTAWECQVALENYLVLIQNGRLTRDILRTEANALAIGPTHQTAFSAVIQNLKPNHTLLNELVGQKPLPPQPSGVVLLNVGENPEFYSNLLSRNAPAQVPQFEAVTTQNHRRQLQKQFNTHHLRDGKGSVAIEVFATPEQLATTPLSDLPVRLLVPAGIDDVRLAQLAQRPNVHVQYLSRRSTKLTPEAQAKLWAEEVVIPRPTSPLDQVGADGKVIKHSGGKGVTPSPSPLIENIGYNRDGRLPSLAGTIPRLTPELETAFNNGAFVVELSPGEYIGSFWPDPESGHQRVDPRVGAPLVRAYNEWRAKASFVSLSPEESQKALDKVKLDLAPYGITFSANHTPPATQYQLISELLAMCPTALLKSGVIKKIYIGRDQAWLYNNEAGLFMDGELTLFKAPVNLTRAGMAFMFLHEAGHGVEKMLTSEQRTQLETAWDIIVKSKIGVIIPESPQATAMGGATERGRSKIDIFTEFIAETNAGYALAGSHLRQKIKAIQDPEARAAYETVYTFFKQLHEGREFGTEVKNQEVRAKAEALYQKHGPDVYKVIHTLDLDEPVRIEIAKIAAAQDGKETSEYIQNYGIESEAARIEIAKIAAAQDGWGTSLYIQNHGIKSEAARIEIAKIAAAQDGEGTSEYIQNYGIESEAARIEVAKIAAAQNGVGTSQFIQNYGIESEAARIEVAKIAVAQHGWGASQFIQNYGIKSEAARIEVAKIAAAQNGWQTSQFIQQYEIKSEAARSEIAVLATITSPDSRTLSEIVNRYTLGLPPFPKKADYGTEDIRSWAIQTLDKKGMPATWADALYADMQRRDVGVPLFLQLLAEWHRDASAVTAIVARGPKALSRFLLKQITGLDLNGLTVKHSARAIADLYEAVIGGQAGVFFPVLQSVPLDPSLVAERKLTVALQVIHSLNRLKGILGSRVAEDWPAVVARHFKTPVTPENARDRVAGIDDHFLTLFRERFQIGAVPITLGQITALEGEWGNLDPFYTLAARFHGRSDWRKELPLLSKVAEATLNGTFRDAKYNGFAGDVEDVAAATAQTAMLKTPAQRAGWRANYSRTDIYKSGGNATAETAESLYAKSRAILTDQVLGHVEDDVGAVSDRRAVDAIKSALVQKPKTETLKAYKDNPAALTHAVFEFLNEATDFKQYQDRLTLINGNAGLLGLTEQLQNDVRTLGDATRHAEKVDEAIVFTTTTDDAKLLLTVGDLVDTSSCQNYRTGSYVQTLLGYVVDANVKAVLSYALKEKEFRTPADYARAKALIASGVKPEFIAAQQQLKIGDMVIDLPKAYRRHVVKLGATPAGEAGLFMERAYAQNHPAEALMQQQVAAVRDQLAKASAAATDTAISIPKSRNPGGVYSDAFGGVTSDAYSLTAPPKSAEPAPPAAPPPAGEPERHAAHMIGGAALMADATGNFSDFIAAHPVVAGVTAVAVSAAVAGGVAVYRHLRGKSLKVKSQDLTPSPSPPSPPATVVRVGTQLHLVIPPAGQDTSPTVIPGCDGFEYRWRRGSLEVRDVRETVAGIPGASVNDGTGPRNLPRGKWYAMRYGDQLTIGVRIHTLSQQAPARTEVTPPRGQTPARGATPPLPEAPPKGAHAALQRLNRLVGDRPRMSIDDFRAQMGPFVAFIRSEIAAGRSAVSETQLNDFVRVHDLAGDGSKNEAPPPTTRMDFRATEPSRLNLHFGNGAVINLDFSSTAEKVIGDGQFGKDRAALLYRDGLLFISYAGGAGNLMINGKTVSRQATAFHLYEGDRVQLGQTSFVVRDPDHKLIPRALPSPLFSAKQFTARLLSPLASTPEQTIEFGTGGIGRLPHLPDLEFRQADDGTISVRDTRAPIVIKELKPGEENFAQVYDFKNMPTYLNGKSFPTRQWQPLRDGDTITSGVLSYAISFEKMSFFENFLRDNTPMRNKATQVIAEANSISELLQRLTHPPMPGSVMVAKTIQDVMSGKKALADLPVMLRQKVEGFIDQEVSTFIAEGYSGKTLTMGTDQVHPKWNATETAYHLGRNARALSDSIAKAQTVDEITDLLVASGVQGITGISTEQVVTYLRTDPDGRSSDILIQKLPYALGLRQRVRDILEHTTILQHGEMHRARVLPVDPSLHEAYTTLDRAEDAIYAQLQPHGFFGRKRATRQAESTYQVLERGKPLSLLSRQKGVRDRIHTFMRDTIAAANELFPKEMHHSTNPYTGEAITEKHVESQYRLARMVLNAHAERPVFGAPSLAETESLCHLLNQHYSHETVTDYLSAQRLVRRELEQMTPAAQQVLAEASAEQRALILETYFGNYQHRHIADPKVAFRLASWLGTSGIYREVSMSLVPQGASLQAVISLGYTGEVQRESNDGILVMHTHPEEHLTDFGKIMGYEDDTHNRVSQVMTLDIDLGTRSRDSRNILFSKGDIRCFIADAKKRYALSTQPQTTPMPHYNAEQRTFKNWVMHPLGGAEATIHLSQDGKPDHVTIRYAKKPGEDFNKNYKEAAKQLKIFCETELNLPTTITEISYDQWLESTPYPVQPN